MNNKYPINIILLKRKKNGSKTFALGTFGIDDNIILNHLWVTQFLCIFLVTSTADKLLIVKILEGRYNF